jgi:DNA-binding MarR family transcriptional regulator
LDKRTEKLLRIINELCNEGYKVVEIAEVLSKLPKKYNLSITDIKNMLKYLEERDYVDVKFIDEKNMCVSSLPKGRLHFENILNQNKITNAYRKLFVCSIIVSGIMSFLGAFLAILILK